jgi:glycerophosphoryl diester phosphodiesterase
MVAAHRGVAAGAAENTIEAFANAIDVGADMVEFDVRRTSDGALIAFHDALVGETPVSALTRDGIAAAAGVRPPLLTEVLRACAGRIRLDVELKEDGYVPEVMAVLRAGFDPAQMIVTSFLPSVIAQAKGAFPELRTGLLVGDGGPLANLPARLRELYPVNLARQVRADYLAPHYRLAALGVLRRAAAAGLPCLLWTVNSPDLIRRYAGDERVAAIITDVAAQAVAIVAGTAGAAPGARLSWADAPGLAAAVRDRDRLRARPRRGPGRGHVRVRRARPCPHRERGRGGRPGHRGHESR